MGLSLSQIKTEKELKSATSLGEKKFKELSILFSNTYSKIYGNSIEKVQQNLDKNFVFSTTDELLFFILFGLKNSMILAVKALIFDIPASTADYNFSKGIKILHECLVENGYMPAREFKNETEFAEYFRKESKLILDVTEFKIQRPSDYEKQKEMYSGKKNA